MSQNDIDPRATSIVIDSNTTTQQRLTQKAIDDVGLSRHLVRTFVDRLNKVLVTYHFDAHTYQWVKSITQLPSNTEFPNAPLTYNANAVKKYRGSQSDPERNEQQIETIKVGGRSDDSDYRYYGVRDSMIAVNEIGTFL